MKIAITGALLFLLTSTTAHAIDGWVADAGPVFLTKAGELSGGGVLQSDVGYALRGRLRYSFGVLAVGGDFQTSSQKVTRGGIESLDGNYLGVTATLHPVEVLGILPYGEVGLGKVAFGDDSIIDDGGMASTYGLGVRIGLISRLGLDAGFRIMRQGGLRAQGIAQELKYDPKLFSVMVSLDL